MPDCECSKTIHIRPSEPVRPLSLTVQPVSSTIKISHDAEHWYNLAKDWAIKMDGPVDLNEYSSKQWATWSKVWAEGSDEEVAQRGGEHSAKGWVELIIADTERQIREHDASESAHSYIQNKIIQEEQARQSADTALQANINAETQARQSADTALQANINAETQARQDSDDLLVPKTTKVNGHVLSSDITIDYTDIPNTPTIGNGKITIKKNNSEVNSFTLNDTSDTDINIIIPTKTSDIENDSEFITNQVDDLLNYTKTDDLADVALSNSYNDLDDVPTNVSDFQNDLNYQTDTQVNTSISTHNTSTTAHTDVRQSITDIQQTMNTYGDIVTHDVDEFATAQQGTKADSALQPSDVVNNVTSTVTNKPLSAYQGKLLQDQLSQLKARGTYLSTWDCTTGLAGTVPQVIPRVYVTGDYFIVKKVGTTNYRPSGLSYDPDIPSTVIETEEVKVNDSYVYDGTVWSLLSTEQVTVSFANLAGEPEDNSNLAAALAEKEDAIEDLDDIRSGAELGSTSIQPNDNVSELINDIGYITNSALTGYATETYVQNHHDTTKQDKTDNTLTTISKTIVGAINELDARPSMPDLDETTITKNSDSELQAISLVGLTSTIQELNHTDGVTSNIQTQINNKQDTLTQGEGITITNNTISTNNIIWRQW